MKKLILSIVAIMAAAIGAWAQDYADLIYGRSNVSYENIHYGATKGSGLFLGKEGIGLNGFGIEEMVGFPLSKTNAIDVELGLQLQAAWGGIKTQTAGIENKLNTNLLRINIPLQFIYHFNFDEGRFKVSPSAGIDFRFNLLARETLKTYADGKQIAEDKTNYFSKFDMNDNTFKRFQMGWHVGLTFEYYNLNLNVSYGTDFTPIYNDKVTGTKINTSNFSIGIGATY